MNKGQQAYTRSSNLSTEKLIKILEYMAQQKEPLRLIDISNALEFNASTTLRFINTLIRTGYVDQDPNTGRYFMTYKICTLAEHQMCKLKNWASLRPRLEEISKLFGETCCLAVERDRCVIYVEVVESPNSMIRSMQRIGSVAPLHCTASGKLLLMNYSVKELDRLIEETGLTRYTDNTITSRQDLFEELRRIRKEGVAYDNEECEIGARCIALPVYGVSGKVIAGISVTGPASRLTDQLIARKLDAMKEIVRGVSRTMGYTDKCGDT